MTGRTSTTTEQGRGIHGLFLIAAVLLLPGCGHDRFAAPASPESRRLVPNDASGLEPQNRENENRPRTSPPEPVALKAYEVRESAFSDFGMSVTTNFEVQWGEKIEWMIVHAIAPGSSAEKAGLMSGDRLLAMDGQLLVGMERDRMLELFFQRGSGERARLLVLGRQQSMPRFVTLVANRPAKTPATLKR